MGTGDELGWGLGADSEALRGVERGGERVGRWLGQGGDRVRMGLEGVGVYP